MVSVLTSYSVGEITRKPSNRPLISVKDEMKRGSWNVDENQNSDNYHRNRYYDGMPLPAMMETEMEKAADAADMSVLFFSDGANF